MFSCIIYLLFSGKIREGKENLGKDAQTLGTITGFYMQTWSDCRMYTLGGGEDGWRGDPSPLSIITKSKEKSNVQNKCNVWRLLPWSKGLFDGPVWHARSRFIRTAKRQASWTAYLMMNFHLSPRYAEQSATPRWGPLDAPTNAFPGYKLLIISTFAWADFVFFQDCNHYASIPSNIHIGQRLHSMKTFGIYLFYKFRPKSQKL